MPRPSDEFAVSRVLEEFGWEGSVHNLPQVLSPDLDEEFAHLPENIDVRYGNNELPVFDYKDQFLDTVRNNRITIVVADTGAGKTTQFPQFLLEDGYARVFVTQPRRAAARNAFIRIREELSDVLGSFAGEDLVSCQTAAGREGPADARIRVVTDGLQVALEFHERGVNEDDVLMVDEAHEWNGNIELLVAYAKHHPRLRFVITSATMQAHPLAEYLADATRDRPPIIEIPGRTFKVEKTEKPDSTAVDEVMRLVAENPEVEEGPNGILVFMPGKREIRDAIDQIQARLPKDRRQNILVFPLHAKLSSTEQQKALVHYPGYTKIVVATDVAQTSLTIPDIKHVVDSGYQRRIEIDKEGTQGLKLVPISKADCEQRAGRTGRVADGDYVLTALNKRLPHVAFNDREDYPSPEITRTDVARNMLRLKVLGIDIRDFDMYHNAAAHTIDLAEMNLKLLGALDDDGELTPIGSEMNEYPVCTSSGRIMVEAKRYREDTRACLAAIVAAKEVGCLQDFAHGAGKRWQALTEEASSDLLVQLDLFIAAQNMTPLEMIEHDLDIDNFVRAQEQYQKIAKLAGAEAGLLEPPSDRVREDIKDCIYAGFITSIYKHDGNGEYVHAFNDWSTRRTISNRSLVSGDNDFLLADPYRIEDVDGEEAFIKHFAENVSKISAAKLGAVALHAVEWRPEGYVNREGKFKQKKRQFLFGIDLGVVEEQPAEPSLALHQEIINYALENPGGAQNQLRGIKRALERLAHLTKSHVPIITHDQIVELVRQAAPADITNPSEIEDNLRLMLADPERKLSLDDFISPQRRERIIENAPPTLEVDGVHLHLRYSSGQPIASHYSAREILKLDDEVYLPDGRKVLFSLRGTRKKFSLLELKTRLSDII